MEGRNAADSEGRVRDGGVEMAVTIGSARSSFGNTKAGDQSGGKEVSTQLLPNEYWIFE